MNQRLSLDGLEVLDAIARRGSFAAAAESLHRVPSAVTYAMRKLETDLDVRLFRKEGRRAVLTAAGETLLREGRTLLAAADQLAETTRQVQRGWESQLTIAVDALVEFDVVVDALEAFYQLDTGTDLHITEEVLSGAWEAVLDDRADIVVGVPAYQTVAAELETRPFQTFDWVFAVAPNHPLASPSKPLSKEDIRPYRAVVAQDSARTRTPLTIRVLSSQPTLSVKDMTQKIAAQCRGLGVGYLPLHRIQQQLADGLLVTPPVEESPAQSTGLIGWKKGQQGRALQWFVEHFGGHYLAR